MFCEIYVMVDDTKDKLFGYMWYYTLTWQVIASFLNDNEGDILPYLENVNI